MKIAVINGPNLNLLGVREPEIYGRTDYGALVAAIEKHCSESGIEVRVFQSNHEGALVDMIQRCRGRADGIVINPAAYTHTSVAILDALRATELPAVEVHLTDVFAREEFRRVSYAGQACVKTIVGMGFDGYIAAIDFLKELLADSTPVKAECAMLRLDAVSDAVMSRFERVTGYESVRLPARATSGSAGYDFYAPSDIVLLPGEHVTVATGIRVYIEAGWVLLLFPRSSLGFKYRLSLDNTVGVIDSDYYFADNEGHIHIKMTNGGDKPLEIAAGSAFAQGVFVPFGRAAGDGADGRRTGGFGSTDLK